jgi:hypothetical protein
VPRADAGSGLYDQGMRTLSGAERRAVEQVEDAKRGERWANGFLLLLGGVWLGLLAAKYLG